MAYKVKRRGDDIEIYDDPRGNCKTLSDVEILIRDQLEHEIIDQIFMVSATGAKTPVELNLAKSSSKSGFKFDIQEAVTLLLLICVVIGVIYFTGEGTIVAILLLFIALTLYFLPAVIAHNREHNNFTAIFVLNLLLGWTFLFWVAALVWSFTDNTS